MQQPVGPDDEDPYAEDLDALLAEGDGLLPHAVQELREVAREESALAGRKLAAVVRLTGMLRDTATAELAQGPHVAGQPDSGRVAETAVVTGLAGALGIPEHEAGRLWALATRLDRALPDTFAALAAGRLDLARATAVAEATTDCALDEAREVERVLLARVGEAPWDGPSPRTWCARVRRAVATVAPAVAQERRARAVTDRAVCSWAGADGDGVLRLTAAVEQIAMAEGVVAALADAWPAEDERGRRMTVDQRRVDALLDLFRRVRDQRQLPDLRGRRSDLDRVTLVLHADTFLRDGPAKHAPGQLRGVGQPECLDHVIARCLADDAIGAGTPLRVLRQSAATSTTTRRGHVDPRRSTTCSRAARGTTSRRPGDSCAPGCTPTAPSTIRCSPRWPSPPRRSRCRATDPARATAPDRWQGARRTRVVVPRVSGSRSPSGRRRRTSARRGGRPASPTSPPSPGATARRRRCAPRRPAHP